MVNGRTMVYAACLGLTATQLRMLAHLLLLGHVGGDEVPIRASLAELVQLGAASSRTKALHALRDLERLGLIERGEVTRVLPPEQWPHDLTQLDQQWRTATQVSAWGPAAPLVDAASAMFELVPDSLLTHHRPTWHPADRPSIEWATTLVKLYERHGSSVFGALAAVGRDPQLLAPFSARSFRRDVWALLIRARRYFPELVT